MVNALVRIKSYLDYGMFQPIQIAAIIALESPQSVVDEIVGVYKKRRDKLIGGMNRAGWAIEPPKATMFCWAKVPEPFAHMNSMEFAKHLLKEAHVAVSPGLGFGQWGEGHVRFALVENEHRIQQAIHGIRDMMKKAE